MKIAIHHQNNSYSDSWIAYCQQQSIPYKIVNAFDSNIIQQLKDCDALMWHHHHGLLKDVIAAKKILFALDHAGVLVYPDFRTGWHFDDKVAQKYLLEAFELPVVPSYIFYNKTDALSWARNTTYPKVFKLKGGAGSSNVRLVRTYKEASKTINKAFNKGFSQFDRIGNLKQRIVDYKNGDTDILDVSKGVARLLLSTELSRELPNEKNYVYFQDFIPNNDHDIRVVVIDGCAVAEKRYVKKNDFRASGSGIFCYENIDQRVIRLALNVAKQLQLQSVAFDFIMDHNQTPLIIEMSYAFGTKGIQSAPGYWDSNLDWHDSPFQAEERIIKYIAKCIS